jgi:hypothetical protein
MKGIVENIVCDIKTNKNDIRNYEDLLQRYIYMKDETTADVLETLCAEGITVGLSCASQLENIYWQLQLNRARNGNFERFMLYIERKRPPHEQFWLPRKNHPIKQVAEGLQWLLNGFKEDENNNKLTKRVFGALVAVGTGKTTLLAFFYAFVIGLYENDPNLYFGHGRKLSDGMQSEVL